ncbi:MAG: insulinase family protein [Saprospiraceae bacterium]|nr:insulinase family protein [Saprospiraceae bacterium]
MIDFSRIQLDNGLTVLLHEDKSTPLVALNVLVNAGSKYDPAGRSGLAHLLEHLMFKGTAKVPDFDKPMQLAGAENNAYTNSDYTTYYCFGPVQNLETYLWLEQDRFKNLSLTEDKVSLEHKVVLEEYLETCVNEPFGDVWHHLLPMMYADHPYQHPTIGKNTVEIQSIGLTDLQAFFALHYHPSRVIVSMAGNITADRASALTTRWFGDWQKSQPADLPSSMPPLFPQQTGIRQLESKVPVSCFYMAWPIPSRTHQDYAAIDLISEVLAGGRSALLYQTLIKELEVLSQVDCYLSGALEGGLFVIEGRLSEGVSFEQAYEAVWKVVDGLSSKQQSSQVMERLKNSMETSLILSEMNALSKAINLGYFELLGDANLINEELDGYRKVPVGKLSEVARQYLSRSRLGIVEYRA